MRVHLYICKSLSTKRVRQVKEFATKGMYQLHVEEFHNGTILVTGTVTGLEDE